METMTLIWGDSLDKHQCELDRLDDREPVIAATFSVSYNDDGTNKVTINDLVVTHRIYSDATAEIHQENTPGNNGVTGSGSSSTPLQYTSLMLAESKAGPKEEMYIMIDPEDEDGGGRSSGKMLHGQHVTFARGRWQDTNDAQSSNKNVLHATPTRINQFLITLPDEEALEAVYRCDMAMQSNKDALHPPQSMRHLFSVLTQAGVPKLQAQYFCSPLNPWAISSQVLGGVDIHTILGYNGGGARAGLHCRTEVLHYHMRYAAEKGAAFKSNTDFRIKGHEDGYSIAPLNGRRVFFSPSYLSKVCVVDATVELDDSTRILSGQEPEKDESDWLFRKVEWGADSVRGLKDDGDGLIEFQHERSGTKFHGLPRGQLVREECPTGFVIVSSTVEEGKEEEGSRTLAVRDHYLLLRSQNDDWSGEEGDELKTPVILPLVDDEMDAIFELKFSEEGRGEIEAKRMEYGKEGKGRRGKWRNGFENGVIDSFKI
ncbi:hypothetical protein KC332_g13936 [Hortaea werneckii]|nr:hypothetical protein KC358_g11049 [Hortaea werneckii]KAI6848687.1 hypothetical protein KC350_g2916 [Hortaea werneckii]KAI6908152.1 hypothetical protein KC348_g13953 [Hortaea werneckii]KAI6933212.1 hypothetical protein KC341_g8446 [Hortaea werneckii]KAI6964203.1 hypothetical protein KC321_g10802 [Hortaea werneckii]